MWDKMETPNIAVTLTSTNRDLLHKFNISVQKGKLLILSPSGEEVATLRVETMDREVKDDDGDYHTKASDNFFLCFQPIKKSHDKDIAEVYIDA